MRNRTRISRVLSYPKVSGKVESFKKRRNEKLAKRSAIKTRQRKGTQIETSGGIAGEYPLVRCSCSCFKFLLFACVCVCVVGKEEEEEEES